MMQAIGRKQLDGEVLRALRKFLADMEGEDNRLPQLRELSEMLGVSVPTVRMAQAVLREEGLLAARQGGRVVATERGRRRHLAIVSELDVLQPRTSRFFLGAMSALREKMTARGHIPELYIGRTGAGEQLDHVSCEHFVYDLEAGRLHGGVLVNVPRNEAWLDLIGANELPLVGAHTNCDFELGVQARAEAAFAHLKLQGAQSVAVIAWLPAEMAGFVSAWAAKSGLVCPPEWTKPRVRPASAGSAWEAFRDIWSVRSDKPDAVVILDDVLFEDVRLAILELDIAVPADLRVVALSHTRGPEVHSFCHTKIYVSEQAYADAALDALEARMAGMPRDCIPALPFSLVEVTETGVVRTEIKS